MSDFRATLKKFLDVSCLERDRSLICSKCDAELKYRQATLSIHDSTFEDVCIGPPDSVWRFSIPYCPQCEQTPSERGCLHFPLRDFFNRT